MNWLRHHARLSHNLLWLPASRVLGMQPQGSAVKNLASLHLQVQHAAGYDTVSIFLHQSPCACVLLPSMLGIRASTPGLAKAELGLMPVACVVLISMCVPWCWSLQGKTFVNAFAEPYHQGTQRAEAQQAACPC